MASKMSDGEKMVYAAAFVRWLGDYHHQNMTTGAAKLAAEQARCAVEALRFGVTFAPETTDEDMWHEMVGLKKPRFKQKHPDRRTKRESR